MSYISPRDALGLLGLCAAEESAKYERAAIRWLGRLARESKDISLDDLQLAAASLGAIEHVLSRLSRRFSM
jgi:hypothetical protein